MKKLEWIISLFNYNHWANIRLLDELEKNKDVCYQTLPISFGKIDSLLWHMYYYDFKIYQRIVENNNDFQWNEELCLEDLFLRIKCLSEQWLVWLNERDFFLTDDTITHDLLKAYSHNIHHRGQIINILSMLARSPVTLDIYFYYSQLTL